MKTTGSLLKEAREKQNLSISEVSMSTKINPKVISAIEDGREGQLPAKTFLKGFVRSYAIYLKLDVDQVMSTLQQDLGEKQEPAPEQVTATVQEKPESPSISANPKLLKGIAAGGVLFLIVMIVTVKGLVEKYEKEKALDPAVQAEMKTEAKKIEEEKQAEAATEKAVENETAAAEAAKPAEEVKAAETHKPESATKVEAAKPTETTAKPAEPAKPVEPAKPAEPAKVVEAASTVIKPTPEVKKPEVKPEPPKTETKAEVKPAPASVSAPVTAPAPAKPAETANAAGLKDNEIILEALDKVDITFAVNNGPATKISLQPAQVHTIKAKGQVAMDVSDGGAVNVILNGQDNGTLGDLGKPKKMKYP